jgi:hypothetical protein
VCDRAFASLALPNTVNALITGYIKPRGRELSREQESFNEQLHAVEREIEQNFAFLKNKFHILEDIYRHDVELFNDIFGTCLALHNLHRFVEGDDEYNDHLWFSLDYEEAIEQRLAFVFQELNYYKQRRCGKFEVAGVDNVWQADQLIDNPCIIANECVHRYFVLNIW